MVLATAALDRAHAAVLGGAEPLLRRSDRADFQANGVLPLAKAQGKNPAALAAAAAAQLSDAEGPIAHCAASGPGFLNIDIADRALLDNLAARAADPRLGVPRTPTSGATVVESGAEGGGRAGAAESAAALRAQRADAGAGDGSARCRGARGALTRPLPGGSLLP